MKPRSWALLTVAAGAAIGVTIGLARASGPPPPGGNIPLSELWQGTATGGYGSRGVPDDYTFPAVPSGRLYYLQSVKQTVSVAVPKSWRQASFAYSKAFHGVPEASTPNLDSLCGLGVLAGDTGTFVAGGGPAPAAPGPGYDTWQPWNVPLPATSSLQVQTGGSVGVGNTVLNEIDYVDGGPATDIRFVDSVPSATDVTVDSAPVPAGTSWLVEAAFVQASGPFSGKVTRKSDGYVLVDNPGTNGSQCTGGYSQHQTSLPLGGFQTVWPSYLSLAAGDQVHVELVAPSPVTIAYFLVLAQLAA